MTKVAYLSIPVSFLCCFSVLQATDDLKINIGLQQGSSPPFVNNSTITPLDTPEHDLTDDEDGLHFVGAAYTMSQHPSNNRILSLYGNESLTGTATKPTLQRSNVTVSHTKPSGSAPPPSRAMRLQPRNSTTIMKECGISKNNKTKLKEVCYLNEMHRIRDQLKKTNKNFQRFKTAALCTIFSCASTIVILGILLSQKTCANA